MYRNDGDGKFADISTIGPGSVGRVVTTLDFDGDGRLDLFIGQDSPGGSVALVHNDGNYNFTDITAKSGLPSALSAYGVAAVDPGATATVTSISRCRRKQQDLPG